MRWNVDKHPLDTDIKNGICGQEMVFSAMLKMTEISKNAPYHVSSHIEFA